MAYDQNTPYQPPRRTPYGQPQPQGSIRAPDAKYRNNQYAQYDESYDPGYSQQTNGGGYGDHDGYGGYNEHNAGVYEEQHWDTNEGYHEEYDQREHHGQRQHIGYRDAPQERSYDSRYQQRVPKGPANHPQPHRQHPRPPPERQGYQAPHVDRARDRGQPQHIQESGQNSGRFGPDSIPRGDARVPQEPPDGRDAGTRSMMEWKAQEKARMKATAVSPDYLPQDTAFPRIGNKQERPSTAEGRDSVRSSDDHKRPGRERSDPRSQRPSGSREQSYNRGPYTDEYAPPQRGQRPMGPPAPRQPPNLRSQPDHDEVYQQDTGSYPDAPSSRQVGNFTSRSASGHDQNWPLDSQQAQAESRSWQQTPAQTNGNDSSYGYEAGAHPGYESRSQLYGYREQANQRPDRRMPPVQRVNTSIPQTMSSSLNHHPLSPVNVIPRPSTASGARQVPVPQTASSFTQVPQSATVENYAAPKPWMQHTKADSLGDLYAGYGEDSDPAAKSRDEEIEEEMPDFDTPDAGSTTNQHKRTKTVDRHLNEGTPAAAPPPMPNMPSQYYDQHARQRGVESTSHRIQPERNTPYTADAYQYGESNRTPMRQNLNKPHYAPPTQPYFAQEEAERRSVDNARQMPYRSGPPSGQRFPQQNAPGQGYRGPVPPGRPGLDRGGTGQSTWSDPGQQRAPSAPPAGQRRPPPQTGGSGSGQQDTQTEVRHSNPDALPHHPTPVRPGLTDQGSTQPSRPPPVRNYNHGAKEPPPAAPPTAQRLNSDDAFAQPVTREELDRLRAEVDASPHNPKRALILAKKLVEASTVLASEGGRLDARMAAKNRERYIMDAHKRIKKLVAQGYPEAQFYLADCYGQGMLGLEVDTKEAFNLYQAAAKAGHAQAAYRTAVCCEMGPEEGGGTRRDYPKAVQWYRRAAALGDPAAMFKLGAVLLKGLLGTPRNVGEAVNWLKRAAERADNDNPHALHELAGLYDAANTNPEVRNKVIADDKYACELFQRAAKLGYKQSQFRLGQAHEYGQLGLPIDNRASITWYTKAAAQGEHQAELALSGWYLTGADGILEHSDTEAYLWARKAAMSEPPLAKALFAMGYFTEMGIGCPASLDEAKKWYGRAASQQFPKALERLDDLKKNGGKGGRPPNSRLTRKDQKRDEAECAVM